MTSNHQASRPRASPNRRPGREVAAPANEGGRRTTAAHPSEGRASRRAAAGRPPRKLQQNGIFVRGPGLPGPCFPGDCPGKLNKNKGSILLSLRPLVAATTRPKGFVLAGYGVSMMGCVVRGKLNQIDAKKWGGTTTPPHGCFVLCA